MSTVNIVLMVVLAAIIGFAMGNTYGQAKMKVLFTDLLNKLTDNMKAVAGKERKKEEGAHE